MTTEEETDGQPRGARALVGRDAELDALARLAHEARSGGSPVATLVGEPGIGKSRLLRELAERAASWGFEVLAGRGAEIEEGLPFSLLIDALDDRCAALGPQVLGQLGEERVAELGAVLPSFAGLGIQPYTTLDAERYMWHHAIHAVLELLATNRPILLILDDVHWADRDSLDLVGHLLRHRVPRSMVVLAYRTHPALPARLIDAIKSASRSDIARSLALPPLPIEDVAKLLDRDVDSSTLRTLHEQSGGNPFFFQELARISGDRPDTLQRTKAETASIEVPAAVRAAIHAELDSLSPRAQDLLRGAAVVGEPVDVVLAAEVAELTGDHAEGARDELVAAELLRKANDPDRLVFRHPIVRRVVYDSRPGMRLRAHQLAAQALTRRGATVAVRAHHLERSASVGDAAAVDVLTEAGQASTQRAPAAAARWFDAALRLLPGDAEPERRRSLLVAKAAALAATGRLRECRSALSRVADLLPPDAPAERARVIGMVARTEQQMGHAREARRLLAEALAASRPGSREAAALQLELCLNYQTAGEWERARATGAEVRTIAQDLGDRSLFLSATAAGALAAIELGDVARARAWIDEAVPEIESYGDEQLAPNLEAVFNLASAEISIERLPAAIAHLERGARVCRTTGQSYVLLQQLVGVAAAYLLQGRLDDARREAETAVEISLLLDSDPALVMSEALRCWAASLQGDSAAAREAGANAVQAAARTSGTRYGWLAHACYAEALADSGESELARAQLAAAGGAELTHIPPAHRPVFAWVIVEAELAAGRIGAADEAARRAEAAARNLRLDLRAGFARYARARVLLATGQPDGAARVAREAARNFEVVGARAHVGRALLLAGRALARAGRAATVELERAHAILDACGARRLAAEAEEEIRDLGVPVSSREATPQREAGGELTPRECEVARLIAEGLTNGKIADRLSLSEKTVETHIAHIFEKLGASSRVEVAVAVAGMGTSESV